MDFKDSYSRCWRRFRSARSAFSCSEELSALAAVVRSQSKSMRPPTMTSTSACSWLSAQASACCAMDIVSFPAHPTHLVNFSTTCACMSCKSRPRDSMPSPLGRREGFPDAILEAKDCNRPAIACPASTTLPAAPLTVFYTPGKVSDCTKRLSELSSTCANELPTF